MEISVRELIESDIPHIVDYWLKSDEAFLVGMGVDLKKLPSPTQLAKMLSNQIKSTYEEKSSYALIWMIDDVPAGHCNVNEIEFGKTAKMHLHMWQQSNRRKGLGSMLVLASLPFFFDHLGLKTLICEPYALNDAPNATLKKCGFEFVKQYVTIPGSLNFEQEVKQWKMECSFFETYSIGL